MTPVACLARHRGRCNQDAALSALPILWARAAFGLDHEFRLSEGQAHTEHSFLEDSGWHRWPQRGASDNEGPVDADELITHQDTRMTDAARARPESDARRGWRRIGPDGNDDQFVGEGGDDGRRNDEMGTPVRRMAIGVERD